MCLTTKTARKVIDPPSLCAFVLFCWLLDAQHLIGLHSLQFLYHSAWPHDPDFFDLRVFSETEVQSLMILPPLMYPSILNAYLVTLLP